MRSGVALGSNLGDRLQHLRSAFRSLSVLHEGPHEELRTSSIFETIPVGCEPGTGSYLNAVVEVRTSLPPLRFLERLRAIEMQLGRPLKRPRNAPRTIDLDVLYYNNLVLCHDDLVIPHPRLAQRRFVLAPLAEIAPDLVLAGHSRPVSALLGDLVDDEDVRLLQDCLDEH
ncbi:MAG TPA: 2-amino-4-hydroxy-6-hydroxymethyldihydropteridine diphosphokinase [Chthoniobacterales bacterium]